MSYYSGHSKRRIKTFNRMEYILACSRAVDDGYELHRRTLKRCWPWFWRIKYKAEYRRYYIIDEEKIAFIPKSQLEYIETGKIK